MGQIEGILHVHERKKRYDRILQLRLDAGERCWPTMFDRSIFLESVNYRVELSPRRRQLTAQTVREPVATAAWPFAPVGLILEFEITWEVRSVEINDLPALHVEPCTWRVCQHGRGPTRRTGLAASRPLWNASVVLPSIGDGIQGPLALGSQALA